MQLELNTELQLELGMQLELENATLGNSLGESELDYLTILGGCGWFSSPMFAAPLGRYPNRRRVPRTGRQLGQLEKKTQNCSQSVPLRLRRLAPYGGASCKECHTTLNSAKQNSSTAYNTGPFSVTPTTTV